MAKLRKIKMTEKLEREAWCNKRLQAKALGICHTNEHHLIISVLLLLLEKEGKILDLNGRAVTNQHQQKVFEVLRMYKEAERAVTPTTKISRGRIANGII